MLGLFVVHRAPCLSHLGSLVLYLGHLGQVGLVLYLRLLLHLCVFDVVREVLLGREAFIALDLESGCGGVTEN